MKTQKPAKRVQRKSGVEFFDYDEFPRKEKAKKPKRGRKENYNQDDNYDDYDDDSY